LVRLKRAARKCLVCPFARAATQTVFGAFAADGVRGANADAGGPMLMLVGEQPGDREDLAGQPFVGPAGSLLAVLLAELGIPPERTYLTNAVKHFKYIGGRGKRRLHQRPNTAEIGACRPWLEAEVATLRPAVIIALGRTAAASVCGKATALGRARGRWLRSALGSARVLVSWHPAAVLRAPDPAVRAEKRAQLKDDLNKAWRFVTRGS
jgi:DNA polymerase